MDKDVFNFNDISDVENEIKLGRGKQDHFMQQIIDIFKEAEKHNIMQLNVNEVLIVYHRTIVKRKNGAIKTNIQIMNKLGAMRSKGILTRISQGTYQLKNRFN